VHYEQTVRGGHTPGSTDTVKDAASLMTVYGQVHYEQTVRAAAGPHPRVVRHQGTPVNYEQTVSNPRVPGYTGTL
jgi:hypothetical protein